MSQLDNLIPPLPAATPANEFEVKVESYDPSVDVVSSAPINQQNVVIAHQQQLKDQASVTHAFVMTRQMLTEFFHHREHDSHNKDTSVITRFSFLPPIKDIHPSSSAVHESH